MSQRVINQLLEQHSQNAFAMAFQMLRCREDASDVIQDACYSLLKQSSLPRDSGEFRMLLFKVVRNKAIDKLRSNKVRKAEVVDEQTLESDYHPDPSKHWESQQQTQALHSALAQLKEEYREIILLKDWQGFSYSELSKILDIESGTVMSRLHRARMALRKLLKGGSNND